MSTLDFGESLYKTKEQIAQEVMEAWQARIPDISTAPTSVVRLFTEVYAEVTEALFLRMQLAFQEQFIATASEVALERFGDLYGRPRKAGTKATGTVRFSGEGGTSIPIGTEVLAPQIISDDLAFITAGSATIPNPGIADAPTLTVGATGLITGTIEYGVSFVTAAGETTLGAGSDPLTVATKKISVSIIDIGGAGTTQRKLYRRKDGGAWKLVTTIADNTTTTYLDNIADGSLGAAPLADSTAERIVVSIEAEEVGEEYNVDIGGIYLIGDAVSGVTDVLNTVAAAGGSNGEDVEEFRYQLSRHVRNPQSGAKDDLEDWAVEVDGVAQATAVQNSNMGTPTNGHYTVYISGPGGTIPDSDVVAATLAFLQGKEVANVTVHVDTFDALTVNTTITVVLDSSYTALGVTPSVSAAISAYYASVPVGGMVYKAGIVAACFGLPGILTLTVTAPSADVDLGATEKAILGTLTVNT